MTVTHVEPVCDVDLEAVVPCDMGRCDSAAVVRVNARKSCRCGLVGANYCAPCCASELAFMPGRLWRCVMCEADPITLVVVSVVPL